MAVIGLTIVNRFPQGRALIPYARVAELSTRPFGGNPRTTLSWLPGSYV